MGQKKVGIKTMNNYRYFENVEKNAYLTNIPCQFCGREELCLDGAFFDRDDIESICLECFNKKKVNVDIPDYIKNRVEKETEHKVETLKYTPPVPWIQNNDWPVCCDDYMVYIGEWEQDEFIAYSVEQDGKSLLKELLTEELVSRVENFDVLWDDLGNETAAFVFRCPQCGKRIVICQDY